MVDVGFQIVNMPYENFPKLQFMAYSVDPEKPREFIPARNFPFRPPGWKTCDYGIDGDLWKGENQYPGGNEFAPLAESGRTLQWNV